MSTLPKVVFKSKSEREKEALERRQQQVEAEKKRKEEIIKQNIKINSQPPAKRSRDDDKRREDEPKEYKSSRYKEVEKPLDIILTDREKEAIRVNYNQF